MLMNILTHVFQHNIETEVLYVWHWMAYKIYNSITKKSLIAVIKKTIFYHFDLF